MELLKCLWIFIIFGAVKADLEEQAENVVFPDQLNEQTDIDGFQQDLFTKNKPPKTGFGGRFGGGYGGGSLQVGGDVQFPQSGQFVKTFGDSGEGGFGGSQPMTLDGLFNQKFGAGADADFAGLIDAGQSSKDFVTHERGKIGSKSKLVGGRGQAGLDFNLGLGKGHGRGLALGHRHGHEFEQMGTGVGGSGNIPGASATTGVGSQFSFGGLGLDFGAKGKLTEGIKTGTGSGASATTGVGSQISFGGLGLGLGLGGSGKISESISMGICDPSVPHVEYPGDCFKFKHCTPTPEGGWMFAEKTCGPTMMFNPKSMVCDWIESVIAIKPECGKAAKGTGGYITGTGIGTGGSAVGEVSLGGLGLDFGAKGKLTEGIKTGTGSGASATTGVGSQFSFGGLGLDFGAKGKLTEGIKTGTGSGASATTGVGSQISFGGLGLGLGLGGSGKISESISMGICDPSVPHVEYPGDCFKFKHCTPTPEGGWMFAEKTCGPTMMFNPKSMVCDWIESVIAIKPECGKAAKGTGGYITGTGIGTGGSAVGEVSLGGLGLDFGAKGKLTEGIKTGTGSGASATTGVGSQFSFGGLGLDFGAKGKLTEGIKTGTGSGASATTGVGSQISFGGLGLGLGLGGSGKISESISMGICDPSVPHVEYPGDCFKFKHCTPTPEGGWMFAEKTCGPTMMFNPKSMVCDWIESVIAIKPECGKAAKGTGGYITGTGIGTGGSAVGEVSLGGLGLDFGAKGKLTEGIKTGTGSGASATTGVGSQFSFGGLGLDFGAKGKLTEGIKTGTGSGASATTGVGSQISFGGLGLGLGLGGSGKISESISMGICDPSVPHVEYPGDCFKFKHCTPTPEGGWMFAEKTCGPTMMFNPKSMVCDWIESVIAIKPECGKAAKGTGGYITGTGIGTGGSAVGEVSLGGLGLNFGAKGKLTEGIKTGTGSGASATTGVGSQISFGGLGLGLGLGGSGKISESISMGICDPSVPHVEYPGDCFKFKHCTPTPEGGWMFAEKTCGPTMMFNPKSMVCDWIESVIAIKPECGKAAKGTGGYITGTGIGTGGSAVGEVSLGGLGLDFGAKGKLTEGIKTGTGSGASATSGVGSQISFGGLGLDFGAKGKLTEGIKTGTGSGASATTGVGSQISFGGLGLGLGLGGSGKISESISMGICDPSVPHVEYPGDCFKFKHCTPTPEGGWMFAEKTCGPTMMFNPKSMVCDWIESVIASKPECGKAAKGTGGYITGTGIGTGGSAVGEVSLGGLGLDFGAKGKLTEGIKTGTGSGASATTGVGSQFSFGGLGLDFGAKGKLTEGIKTGTGSGASATTGVGSQISFGGLGLGLGLGGSGKISESISMGICDPSVPHVEYPGDCFKFKHCTPTPEGGWMFAEKTCGPTMMFNPKSMVCDWIESVIAIKPECGKAAKGTGGYITGTGIGTGGSAVGEVSLGGLGLDFGAKGKLTEGIKTGTGSGASATTGVGSQISFGGLGLGLGLGGSGKISESISMGICDPSVPHVEYPGDCFKFKHCTPTPEGGWMFAEKTCGPTMMFNPKSMVCDWIESVIASKPECGKAAKGTGGYITGTGIGTGGSAVGEVSLGGLGLDFGAKGKLIEGIKTGTGSGASATTGVGSQVSFGGLGLGLGLGLGGSGKISESISMGICDPSVPHVEYPGDCFKFKHCTPTPEGGWMFAEKTCGPTMMFNPKSMVCDWIESVIAIKPMCGKLGSEFEIEHIKKGYKGTGYGSITGIGIGSAGDKISVGGVDITKNSGIGMGGSGSGQLINMGLDKHDDIKIETPSSKLVLGGGLGTQIGIGGNNELDNAINHLISGTGSIKSGWASGGHGTFDAGIKTPKHQYGYGTSKAQCSGRPNQPMNAALKCTPISNTCKATCIPNYQFPNGQKTLFFSCVDGEWTIKDSEWPEVPSCEAICMPRCENNGICVSPGQCTCPENFRGPQCQYENKLCLESPPPISNARLSCSKSQCTVTCAKGNRFPDGSTNMNLICKNGEWISSKSDLAVIPNCEPVCSPPCQNGGNCLSFNVCQCPPEFRGPYCQYSVEACNPKKKLKFNGGFNCFGSGDSFSCSLYCPSTVSFSFPPESVYTCNYAVGKFLPENIPSCVFDEDMEVIYGGYQEGYNQSTGGWSKSGSKSQYEIDYETNLSTKQGVKGKGKVTEHDFDYEFIKMPGVYNMYLTKEIDFTYRQPKPSICMTWNGNKFKTFDGLIYSFPLYCSHIILHDQVDGAFSVVLRSCPFGEPQPCPHAIVIFLQNMMYTFENENGKVKLYSPKSELPIPSQLVGMRVTMVGHNLKIVLDSIKTAIIWDTQKLVTIEASASLWNRTSGLCGTMDQDVRNDYLSKTGILQKSTGTFVDSWQAPNVDKEKDKCLMKHEEMMDESKCEPDRLKKAKFICEKLITNPKLTLCLKGYKKEALISSCITDYCFCNDKKHSETCACDGVSVLARDCVFQGINLENGWRDLEFCPIHCKEGRVYKACGPTSEPSCGFAATDDKDFHCTEGCFCPTGTIQHEGECIEPEECPCKLRGKTFKAGVQIQKECNSCTCEKGNWKCTNVNCGSRCGAIGDPHYLTFDGKRYDFMGQCSYYLLKTENLSVIGENVACPGSISEAMDFAPSVDMPSCTKSVTITYEHKGKPLTIKLKQGRLVLLDGLEVSKLPKTLANGSIKIRQASSTFLLVDFQDGLRIWWDGMTRVYIDAPASYRGQTKGLCGTFNSNQQDDFLTPEGDIESIVEPFADKWRTKESCPFLTDSVQVPHPCQLNLENKNKAEQICEKLKGPVFEDCHWHVDYMPYYEDCMYDVCACKDDVKSCMCPILSSYAAECARHGVVLNWRYTVNECAIKCPPGQVYEECGDSCTRACADLQSDFACKKQCIEGCRCPDGQHLDENSECVPTASCNCVYKGMTFKSGYKEVRAGNKFLELCSCTGAQWICKEATDSDSKKYPPAADIKNKCSVANNEEFTTCEPVEPVTCKNMHFIEPTSPADCIPGCTCKKGYVLDVSLKKCVLPKDCSCHHGGRSYNDGDKIQEDCNTCDCKSGKWSCTKNQCASVCSAWGDSHFTTYDGKDFDFQGVCNYVLSKGSLDGGEGFSVVIQNVLCGSLGETCSKSLEISKLGSNPATVTLSSDSPVPGIKTKDDVKVERKGNEQVSKSLLIHRAGTFVVVEAPNIGLQVKWDRGTRVYVKLDNRWRGRVKGLCGNYNGDAQDDLKTPSSGIETSPLIFGDSWKLQDFCAKPIEQADSCAKHPHRQMWSQRKCGILKSNVFQRCHSEVPVDKFLKRCIYDTCACDQGGDCECLCTAISAYAHACAMKGVPIKWRTPDLCPMQCDPTCSNYSPCISTCPIETCDNILDQGKEKRMCIEDTCVEGCEIKKCPEGQIYLNESYSECVPKSFCKPICMEINGVNYYEGDIIKSDACQTCRCTRNKEVCSGVPCTTELVEEIFTTGIPYQEQDVKCKTGWSSWINQDKKDLMPGVKIKVPISGDKEPLPSYLMLKNLQGGSCKIEDMSEIECRTVNTHKSPKSTGEDVECSLERGLICKGKCSDYEIRVFCDCEHIPKTTTRIPTTTFRPVTKTVTSMKLISSTEKPKIITECDPTIPHVEYPGDCYKFKHCMPSPEGGWVYAEKTCGPTMMFNPKSMICDWIETVVAIKSECGIIPTTTERIERPCPPGQEWSSCAVPCGRACHYYGQLLKQSGKCSFASNECEADCVESSSLMMCPPGFVWRDKKTCVGLADCTCMTRTGKLLKPGETFSESECEICQCIDNNYICNRDSCDQERVLVPLITSTRKPIIITPVTTTTKMPILTVSTVTPPKKCDPKKLVPMIEGDFPLSDAAFSASSALGPLFKPQYSRLHSAPTDISSGSWSPEINDEMQYLQIEFPKLTPLFGVVIQGSPIFDQYVTLFKILYSFDGSAYHYLKDETDKPQLFYGPVDGRTPIETLFKIPIEAKTVRIYPLKWHESIAIRVELLGCSTEIPKTTTPTVQITTPTTTTVKPKISTPTTTILANITAKTVMPPKITTTTTTVLPKITTTTTTTAVPKIITTTVKPITITMPTPMLITTPTVKFQYVATLKPTIPTMVVTLMPLIRTTPIVDVVEEPMCDDPMGVENGEMQPSQVYASSSKITPTKTQTLKLLDLLKLSSKKGWRPNMDTLNEFIYFDFLEKRNLTGVITKGGDYGWVTAYNVLYSNDLLNWNTVVNPDKTPKVFRANVDAETPKTNYFKHPIQAKYLKIVPIKWHESIEMKIEPIGCFHTYPVDEFAVTIEYATEGAGLECGVCPGVPMLPSTLGDTCKCYPPLFWNGQECNKRSQCPCMVGHIPYDVGAQYEAEDCSQCVCVLGGVAQCKPKKCPPCEKGLRLVKSDNCECNCEPCPELTVMCPTSGICIAEESWCDGIEDCPDDEVNCPPKGPTVDTTLNITKTCTTPQCLPGYNLKVVKGKGPQMSPMFQQSSGQMPQKYSHMFDQERFDEQFEQTHQTNLAVPPKPDKYVVDEEDECIEFICLPEKPKVVKNETVIRKCPKPNCPEGYSVELELSPAPNQCAKYTCEPLPQNDAVCNVTGRTFNTFDNTEFKFDICSHVLARDFTDDNWSIILMKNCTAGNFICTKELEIVDKLSKFAVIIYSDFTLNYNGYRYTVEQLQKAQSRMNFVVSKVGDTILFVSHLHGFWVSYDRYGDVKVGVSTKHIATVDGLCGYFNGLSEDDKRLPAGDLAKSTLEFGDSWYIDRISKDHCEPHACPKHLQDEAWQICNSIRDQTFSACVKAVDIEKFVSKCIETACDCLKETAGQAAKQSTTKDKPKIDTQKCKCSILQTFVVECLAADETVHLDTWRSQYHCESPCPVPLIHQDCYKRRCEPSCDMLSADSCPFLPGTCFSGCYCPQGTVRKEQTCVPITECRDCVCDGFGKSQYVTYDRKNFTFDGNCTYLLSRDQLLKNAFTFQVYVTVGPCESEIKSKVSKSTCAKALHILNSGHVITIQRVGKKQLDAIVDGKKLRSLPLMEKWLQLIDYQSKGIKIELVNSQVEMTILFDDLAFAIRVPSFMYGGKMEGLCGDCNSNPDDDLKINKLSKFKFDLKKTPSMKDIVTSWLADEPALKLDEEQCESREEIEMGCVPLPPEKDPCFKIMDQAIFGQCHLVVDPIMYVSACQKDFCLAGPTQMGACQSIAAYARECARNGLCINWRKGGLCSYDCPAHLTYNPCGCPETCESIKKKDELVKMTKSTKSQKNILDVCNVPKIEGCFCSKDKVLRNDKCIPIRECNPCDDKGHFPGDVWYPDKCSKCECLIDGKTMCSKKECPKETVCSKGFSLIVMPTEDECCKKYVCVPEPTVPPAVECADAPLPKCNIYQNKKMDYGPDGCPKYICECKPVSDCPPVEKFKEPFKVGQKVFLDTSGCCAVSKLICDKTLCPTKPNQCKEEFYEIMKINATIDDCCDEYKCIPPKNKCIVQIDGKNYLKNIGEKWPTKDVCLTQMCSIGADGKPFVKEERDICTTSCELGFKIVTPPGKCCGKCEQSQCKIGDRLYNPGDVWASEDNCTRFKCEFKDNHFYISSELETCPDITDCPDYRRYFKGCCQLCKPEVAEQKNCIPASLADAETIGLVRQINPGHGLCKNIKPIRGFTECHGSCSSGTKYNPDTFQYDKQCDCCSIQSYEPLVIDMVCADGFKFKRDISVPKLCSCQACTEQSQQLVTKTKTKTKY